MRKECDDDWLEAPVFEEEITSQQTAVVIWLLLAGEGGWWTTGQIAKRLAYLDPDVLINRVWIMGHRQSQLKVRTVVEKGQLRYSQGRKYIPEKSVLQYMVDVNCSIPLGVTAGAAAKALSRRVDLK